MGRDGDRLMAGRGPAPKDPEKRQRRNAPTFPEVVLGTEPAAGAPKIARAAWRRLHVETRAWWHDWVSAPQASQFGATDWRRLRMVVLPLVERLNRAIDDQDDARIVKLSAELAKQEREFGATPAARMQLRWTLRGKPEPRADQEPPRLRPVPNTADPRRPMVEDGQTGS